MAEQGTTSDYIVVEAHSAGSVITRLPDRGCNVQVGRRRAGPVGDMPV